MDEVAVFPSKSSDGYMLPSLFVFLNTLLFTLLEPDLLITPLSTCSSFNYAEAVLYFSPGPFELVRVSHYWKSLVGLKILRLG